MTTILPPAGLKVKEDFGVSPLVAENVTDFKESPEEVLPIELRSHYLNGGFNRGTNRWLTVSAYLEPEHQLDIESVDTPNRLLALALTQLQPATPEYAKVSYNESLNWPKIMSTLKTLAATEGYRWTRQSFYVVEFRSRLKQDIDVDLLFKLDKESHIEATQSGGLLKYWFGVPDAERRNLATCLWRSKQDAINGGLGPWHKQARAVIAQMYEQIDVKGLLLTVEDDVEGWSFAPYQ
ncbi:hypothetical protein A1O3_09074 [Capronia epimyces CBS 606.96]|uniref:Uncharacterized protein n=1 Tax=Capronia epimyces CBS 606.96 TaxID=1182542 RepID=W9XKS9_9EURO|nr:uncharacterized protein A1O3_09074 [Capronia epimyces CBS 606.96]EXJ77915.1 hypothetical protein A1O3_09074 [Capronia epimyces CBS 606.96]